MKNLITCSIMLAGYVVAGFLFICGALLYLPFGMLRASLEIMRDKKARAPKATIKPILPELGQK